MTIYFDNAATSWPKPPEVRAALEGHFGEAGGNPGRSGHRMSIAAARVVEDARDRVAELFGMTDPGRVIFTKNATEALNVAIYGVVGPGGHVVTSSIEHNSVMRPLRHLEALGAEVTVVPCAPDGTLDADDVRRAIRPDTRLVVTLHGSNVTGALLPIAGIARAARTAGVPYLVDASQTAGAVPLDMEALGIDLLAFTGHKSMLGLTGTGGLCLAEGIEVPPLMRGGTGSRSDLEFQPDFLPDALESGTMNTAGLAGLAAGVGHVLGRGVEAIHAHELALVARFVEGVAEIEGVTEYGPKDLDQRCGVISFNVAGMTCSEVGTLLDRDYEIMSRVGLHCAPGAHRTIGTFPTGTVRFGFGAFSTVEEVDRSLEAIREIAAWSGADRGGRDDDDRDA
jgi:cysteine desulfurase family protein